VGGGGGGFVGSAKTEKSKRETRSGGVGVELQMNM